MLILQSNLDNAAVILFGHGLIGSAIERSLQRRQAWRVTRHSFPWEQDADGDRRRQLETVVADLGKSDPGGARSVHIVWSAGRAGFSATAEETTAELKAFQQIIEFAESVEQRGEIALHLHVFSSAGGLFEGVRGINQATLTCPLRPYGELKLAQEAAASDAKTTSCSIYRPTSVYATVQTGKRRGLIPTLIWNTLNNRTTSIYGNQDTLRDYIWADDIGRFVASRIVDAETLGSHRCFLLATAIPASINRTIGLIENMLMRPVPVQFIASGDNSLDITVSPSSLPRGLRRTELATAIRKIYMRIMSDGMIANG